MRVTLVLSARDISALKARIDHVARAVAAEKGITPARGESPGSSPCRGDSRPFATPHRGAPKARSRQWRLTALQLTALQR